MTKDRLFLDQRHLTSSVSAHRLVDPVKVAVDSCVDAVLALPSTPFAVARHSIDGVSRGAVLTVHRAQQGTSAITSTRIGPALTITSAHLAPRYRVIEYSLALPVSDHRYLGLAQTLRAVDVCVAGFPPAYNVAKLVSRWAEVA